MNENRIVFEDPLFTGGEMDLRAMDAAAAAIHFARALKTFGIAEPEATIVAQNIFKVNAAPTAGEPLDPPRTYNASPCFCEGETGWPHAECD